MFVGGEVVYRRLFDGLEFNRLAGRALFLGPMFYGKLSALVGVRSVDIQAVGHSAEQREHSIL